VGGLASSIIIGGFLIFHLSSYSITSMLGLSSELVPVAVSLGGLVLVFMAFSFALVRFNPGSEDLTKFYSRATVGIFFSAVLSVIDALVLVLFQIWNDSEIFDLGVAILFVVFWSFLISTGAVVADQLNL
jgi:hypothetical protein